MKFINGNEIEAEYVEYGVEYDLGDAGLVVNPCEDEGEARFIAGVMQGKLLARTVYETAWAEVAK